jgi:hypothetical protein
MYKEMPVIPQGQEKNNWKMEGRGGGEAQVSLTPKKSEIF